ncbi:hypothetical protein F5878DRAFT_647967 [Lentinula raphanica]|uniref:Uncharacterized protein n=1 Tax=Lentinula raphanica TaxID=153919 RepID=A0AA38NUW6_9AGAR|nr:hypothetical protein F5878DRAFT_647967 [Lentinula raphanica]
MSRPRPQISTITTTSAAEEEEAAARLAEEEHLRREAEEAAEAERRRTIKEGKKRKAEEEKANKAKKAKVTDSGQGPSSEQLRAARLRWFSRTSNTSTRVSPAEAIGEAGPSRKRQNVGTGGDPSDDEYPGGDDGEDDSSDDEPEPSGDETPKEQEACERCRRLERVEACVPQKGKNTLACQPCHDNKQQCTWTGSVAIAAVPTRKSKPRKAKALKEGFVDMVQGQHELTELVRDSAATTDQRLQALERRFSNLKGTLVNLMRVALGVKEGEG